MRATVFRVAAIVLCPGSFGPRKAGRHLLWHHTRYNQRPDAIGPSAHESQGLIGVEVGLFVAGARGI